jgi:hypothetical protein
VNQWLIAALWLALALIAGLISVPTAISVSLLGIGAGMTVGNNGSVPDMSNAGATQCTNSPPQMCEAAYPGLLMLSSDLPQSVAAIECAPQAHSGARRSRAQNNPRAITRRRCRSHPDDVPWSMNNPGYRSWGRSGRSSRLSAVPVFSWTSCSRATPRMTEDRHVDMVLL